MHKNSAQCHCHIQLCNFIDFVVIGKGTVKLIDVLTRGFLVDTDTQALLYLAQMTVQMAA